VGGRADESLAQVRFHKLNPLVEQIRQDQRVDLGGLRINKIQFVDRRFEQLVDPNPASRGLVVRAVTMIRSLGGASSSSSSSYDDDIIGSGHAFILLVPFSCMPRVHRPLSFDRCEVVLNGYMDAFSRWMPGVGHDRIHVKTGAECTIKCSSSVVSQSCLMLQKYIFFFLKVYIRVFVSINVDEIELPNFFNIHIHPFNLKQYPLHCRCPEGCTKGNLMSLIVTTETKHH
jgi:hypothetical protein